MAKSSMDPRNAAEKRIHNKHMDETWGDRKYESMTEAERDKIRSIIGVKDEREIKKHREAVRNYRAVWHSKSALWKLFHLKYSPKRTPLDKMERHMINKKAKRMG